MSTDIEKLKDCILDIFSVTNPTFELPREQWFMASVLGKNHEYSTSLQHGIIISLIMLAEKHSEENSFGIISTSDYVYSLVRNVLNQVSLWQQWSTIAPSLPLLAEASPKAVLERIEEEVKNDTSELWQLFIPSEDLLTGRNYYTHILWALEKLVWYKSLVVRAIIVLAEICERNFEYKMVNSPSNSLYEVFCLWYPQSCLNYDERIKMLKKICIDYPLTGQMLVKNLLPTGSSTCSPIQKPKWSTLEDDFSSSILISEYNKSVGEIVNISLGNLSNNTEQWEMIFHHISLYQKKFGKLKGKCIDCCKVMEEEDVLKISNYLREQIHRFRKFKDAKWSVSEKYVSQLEQLLHEIEPKGIKQYQYLFKWHPEILNPTPYNKDIPSDYQKEREIINRIRADAVITIIDSYGIDAFIDFCGIAEDTNDLGIIIVEKVFNNSYDFVLLKRFKEINYALYATILWTLVSLNGLDVLIDVLTADKSLSDTEKGDALCHTPLSPETWAKLNLFNQDTVTYYWEYVRVFRLDEKNKENTDYFIDKLIEYSRPFSAVEIIAYSDYNNTDIIIRILESCLQLQEQKEPLGMSLSNIQQYHILNLFDKLYENQNIDELMVARLEIAYLPYFRHDGNPKCLVSCLQKNPKEYIAFISKCYKPDEPSDGAFDEISQSQVHIALDVLDLFKTIPGCNEKVVSEDKFSSWINEAQKYANELGFSKAFESCLGKLLSQSPAGFDGIFPHEFVRTFLERNDNPSLVNAFIIGTQNKRGVHWGTGGMEEKEMAFNFYNNAQAIRITHPKTSAILEQLGDVYKRESLYEQKQELLDFRE